MKRPTRRQISNAGRRLKNPRTRERSERRAAQILAWARWHKH
jgi:hypothetical protein